MYNTSFCFRHIFCQGSYLCESILPRFRTRCYAHNTNSIDRIVFHAENQFFAFSDVNISLHFTISKRFCLIFSNLSLIFYFNSVFRTAENFILREYVIRTDPRSHKLCTSWSQIWLVLYIIFCASRWIAVGISCTCYFSALMFLELS